MSAEAADFESLRRFGVIEMRVFVAILASVHHAWEKVRWEYASMCEPRRADRRPPRPNW